MNYSPHSPLATGGFLEFVGMASIRSQTELGADGAGLATSISLLIRRANRRLAADTEKFLPEGLSMANFRVCFTLWAVGPLEPHRIAEASLMSRAAVSAARKMLESQGLVKAQNSASDQRSIVLSLTERGRALTENVHRQNVVNTEGKLSVLSVHEQHLLMGLLGKIADGHSQQQLDGKAP
ncbi:MarR family transcriptional regulator [Okibacterium endophyticum]